MNREEEQDGEASVQRNDESVPEYQEILNRVASAPRNYQVPRRVSRRQLEQAFLTSFELIGGLPRLALWADSNPTEFYRLISKLFPQQVEAKIGADESLASILTRMGRVPATLEAQDAEVLSVEQRPALDVPAHTRTEH